MNETTPAPDASATPTGLLGISHPKAPRICPACGSEHIYSHSGQCVACAHDAFWARVDAELAALIARVGSDLEIIYREDAPLARRWELRFERDGDPVALCSCPLEAVQAGEELL